MRTVETKYLLPGVVGVVALAALAVSARSLALSRRLAEEQALTVRAMEGDIQGLASRISALARQAGRPEPGGLRPSAPAAVSIAPAAGDGATPPAVPQDVAALAETVSGMDPEFLRSMHADYQQRKAVQEYQQKALARNEAQRRADAAKYDGEKLAALYDQAISPQNRDRDTALTSMLTEYPDANVTGMALAERALEAAMGADTASVESYYKALSANANFSELVTDMGIEAVPTLQKFLIGQYIQAGRYEEATALVDALEHTYTDSYVAERGRSGDPEWMPVSQVVQNLRQEVTSAASGQGVGSTGGPGSASPQPAGGATATPGTGFHAPGSTLGGPQR
jgi:hypothetical protein